MEGQNNQGENSSKFVQKLLLPPPEPHHTDSETNPQNNSEGGRGPSPNRLPRPRGRPRGSKNKPKAPTLVMCHSPNALMSLAFKVPAGTDILETLHNYAKQRGRGICVLNGKGTVSNVIIRQPMSSSGGVVTLQGAFEILLITGTVLPSQAPPGFGGLSIVLSGGQGQVLGGNVVGPLIAKGQVDLMATSFADTVLECLPLEDHEEAAQEDAENGANQVQQVQPVTSQTGNVAVGIPLFNAGPVNCAFSGDFSSDGSNAAQILRYICVSTDLRVINS